MTDKNEPKIVESMLQMTTEDDWDDLPAATRLKLAKIKMDGNKNLSEDEVQWLIDEQNRAMADLKEAMVDMMEVFQENLKPYLESIAEAMEPWAEMAEDIDESDIGSQRPDASDIAIPHSVDPNDSGNEGPYGEVYLDGRHIASIYDEHLMETLQKAGYEIEVKEL